MFDTINAISMVYKILFNLDLMELFELFGIFFLIIMACISFFLYLCYYCFWKYVYIAKKTYFYVLLRQWQAVTVE